MHPGIELNIHARYNTSIFRPQYQMNNFNDVNYIIIKHFIRSYITRTRKKIATCIVLLFLSLEFLKCNQTVNNA